MTYPAASWRALRALGVPFPVPRPPRVLEAPAAVWRRVLDVLEAQVARHVAAAERTVCLDFDGTLTQPVPYTPGEATAPPRPGLVRALRALHGAGYRLVVLTARPPGEVHGWLHRHQVAAYIDEVTNTKPPAAAYVDDRGVTFDGDWGAVHTEIERLQHTEPRPVAGNDAGTGLHAEWDEDKHPRDAKGQFSETGAITLERLPPFRGPHAMREATIIDGETGHGVMQEGASHGELVERLRERGLPLRTYVRGMVPEERQAATGAVIELIGPVAELAPMAAAFLRERRPNMYVLVGYGRKEFGDFGAQKERDFETWQEAATWLESKGRRTVSAAEWEEDKHPRDAHGRFAESEGEAQTRLTPSQRERLAGTKVVGPTGAPRMVYHGTTRAFEDFTPEHADPEALFGPGFYFTEDPEVASGYTQGTGELAKARERETTLETENVTLEKTIARMREANDPALPKMEEWLVHNRAELAALQTTERPQVRPAFLAIAHPFDADTDRLTPKQLATLGWPTTGRTDDGEELRGHAGDLLWLVEHQQGVAALFPEALQKLGYDGITHIGGKLTGGQAHRVWIAFRPTQVVSAFSAAAEFDESKHPRDERGRFSETAAETEAVGECFSWANRHAQPGDTIVHATVHHPWDHHAYPHAWIERGDRVLDWQSAEQGLGPGRQGWPKQKFYDAYAPTDRHTYTPDEVRVKMLRTGHHGPWDAAADWDEEKHPRDEHGLWVDTDGAQRDARTGMRVFRTAADVEEFKSWGEQKWKWKDQGNLLRGKPLAYADLPDTLYHATTRLDALAQSDRLKGQHGDAGLGGGIADGVSLTTSRADAQLIVTELTRAHAMVSGDLSAAAVRARLDAYARADERTGHLPPGTLQRGVDAAMQGFEVNLSIAKEHTDPKTGEPEDKSAEWSPGLAYDAFRMYLQCRSTDAQKASGLGYKEFDVSDSPLRNPLLFTNQEVLRTLDPTQFGVIAVPRAAVPSTAVLEPGDDYLHEVRVYGDVSLKSATLHAAADFDESKHPRDEHGRFTDAGGAERTLHVVELPPNAAPWRQYMTAYLFDAQGHGVAQQGAMHQELYEAMRDRHGTNLMGPEEHPTLQAGIIAVGSNPKNPRPSAFVEMNKLRTMAPVAAAFLERYHPAGEITVNWLELPEEPSKTFESWQEARLWLLTKAKPVTPKRYTPEEARKKFGAAAEFDESLHPRDDHGQFTETGGGAPALSHVPPAREEFGEDIAEQRTKALVYDFDWQHATLDDLRTVADEVAWQGGKPDLCLIYPPLCERSLGVEREAMPQVTSEAFDQLLTDLRARGVRIEPARIAPSDLAATQNEINARRVLGLVARLNQGPLENAAPVIVSNDGYIVDGHHRWAAEYLRGPSTPMDVVVIDLPIRTLLEMADQVSVPKRSFYGAAEWDEDKHPRDDHGQFTETGTLTLERLPDNPSQTMRDVVVIDGATGRGMMQRGAIHHLDVVDRMQERGLSVQTYVRAILPEEGTTIDRSAPAARLQRRMTDAVVQLIGPMAELAPMAAALLRERQPSTPVIVDWGQNSRDFETWQEAAAWLESKGRYTPTGVRKKWTVSAEYEESEHPRDEHGRWEEKGAASGPASEDSGGWRERGFAFARAARAEPEPEGLVVTAKTREELDRLVAAHPTTQRVADYVRRYTALGQEAAAHHGLRVIADQGWDPIGYIPPHHPDWARIGDLYDDKGRVPPWGATDRPAGPVTQKGARLTTEQTHALLLADLHLMLADQPESVLAALRARDWSVRLRSSTAAATTTLGDHTFRAAGAADYRAHELHLYGTDDVNVLSHELGHAAVSILGERDALNRLAYYAASDRSAADPTPENQRAVDRALARLASTSEDWRAFDAATRAEGGATTYAERWNAERKRLGHDVYESTWALETPFGHTQGLAAGQAANENFAELYMHAMQHKPEDRRAGMKSILADKPKTYLAFWRLMRELTTRRSIPKRGAIVALTLIG